MELESTNLEFSFNEKPLTLPKLSAYMDYREFLRDYYSFKREETRQSLRPYTYAHFAAAADIKSPNYLKLIIEGQRNLSDDMVGKFAKALQLSKEESDEFKLLVTYSQAKDPMERNRYLKDLAEVRVRRMLKSGQLDAQPWEKVPGWIAWVLYTMTEQKNVNFEPENLKRILKGRASIDDIRKALEGLLLGGELIRDTDSGRIKKGRLLMQGSEKVPTELIKKLQTELICLGLEALFRDPPQEREFGSLTMALNDDEFEHLKFELRQYRKRLYKDNAIKRLNGPGKRVYQLNIQLFAVSEDSEI